MKVLAAFLMLALAAASCSLALGRNDCARHPEHCAAPSPTPRVTPSPSPSPTPSPTASPTPTPSPTATPSACSRVATAPADGQTDATAGLLADIAATPAGGTLCLLDATYRVNGQLRIVNRNGLTVEGNGALLTRQPDANNSLWLFDQGGNDIHLRNFDVRGGGTQCGVDRPALENGHAIDFRGVLRATVDHVGTNDTTGEAVYIAGGRLTPGNDASFRSSDNIVLSDMMVICTGRMGIAITDGGNNVQIRRVEFYNVAGYAFDIEPNGHTELGNPGAHDVLFEDNLYHANTVGSHIGVSKFISISSNGTVYNLTFQRNHGVSTQFRIVLNGGATYRIHDVLIDANVGDASSADYPIELHNSDRVQVTNNRQPLRTGQPLVFQSGCTGVTIAGNS